MITNPFQARPKRTVECSRCKIWFGQQFLYEMPVPCFSVFLTPFFLPAESPLKSAIFNVEDGQRGSANESATICQCSPFLCFGPPFYCPPNPGKTQFSMLRMEQFVRPRVSVKSEHNYQTHRIAKSVQIREYIFTECPDLERDFRSRYGTFFKKLTPPGAVSRGTPAGNYRERHGYPFGVGMAMPASKLARF